MIRELLKLKLQLIGCLSLQIELLRARNFDVLEKWMLTENDIISKLPELSDCGLFAGQITGKDDISHHFSMCRSKIKCLLSERQYLLSRSLEVNRQLINLLKDSVIESDPGAPGYQHVRASLIDRLA